MVYVANAPAGGCKLFFGDRGIAPHESRDTFQRSMQLKIKRRRRRKPKGRNKAVGVCRCSPDGMYLPSMIHVYKAH